MLTNHSQEETIQETTEETTQEETPQEETQQETSELTEEQQIEKDTEGMTEEEKEEYLDIVYYGEKKKLSKDEARELSQKGMNYDKVKQKLDELENDPRLSFVEKQAEKFGFKDINDYLKAVEKAEEQERVKELAEKEGISTELAERLHNLEIKEQEREKQSKEIQLEKEKQRNYKEFLDYFSENNGRDFDFKTDEIPTSVWKEFEEGNSLIDAYAKHENQILRDKLKEYENSKIEQEQNEKNAEKSTGSVTGKNESETGFISENEFNANKNDRNWVIKNLNKINKSRQKW